VPTDPVTAWARRFAPLPTLRADHRHRSSMLRRDHRVERGECV